MARAISIRLRLTRSSSLRATPAKQGRSSDVATHTARLKSADRRNGYLDQHARPAKKCRRCIDVSVSMGAKKTQTLTSSPPRHGRPDPFDGSVERLAQSG